MANILGVNIETPQEAQQRLVREQTEGLKSMRTTEQQLGFNFGMAIASAVGHLDKSDDERLEAIDEARRDADRASLNDKAADVAFVNYQIDQQSELNARRIRLVMEEQGASEEQIQSAITAQNQGIHAQKERIAVMATEQAVEEHKNHFIAQGAEPVDADIMARAGAASRLRALGGSENIALANQFTDVNTRVMAQQRQQKLEEDKLRAETELLGQRADTESRKQLGLMSLDELRSESEQLRARIPTLTGPAKEAAEARLNTLQGRAEEKKIEDFIPLDGLSAESLGLTQEQLVALATPDGIPRETFDNLLDQRRLDIADASLQEKLSRLPARSQAIIDNATSASFAATTRSRENYRLASDVLTADRAEGIAGKGQQAIWNALGIDNGVVRVQAQVNQVMLVEALKNRPPGATSDFEFKKLLETQLDPNADANQVAQYLTGAARLRAYEAAYEQAKATWFDDPKHRDLRGFAADWKNNQADKAWQQIKADMPVPIPGGGGGDGGDGGDGGIINDPLVQQYLNPATGGDAPATGGQATVPTPDDPRINPINPGLPGTL